MKDATSESPRSVTGRSPRIKFPAIVRRDDAELTRAEQIAAMKEFTMYQRIMSQRAPDAAYLPPPVSLSSSWNSTSTFKGLIAQKQPNALARTSGSGQGVTNDADLEGIFEMDL